jgi:hypothetical protein
MTTPVGSSHVQQAAVAHPFVLDRGRVLPVPLSRQPVSMHTVGSACETESAVEAVARRAPLRRHLRRRGGTETETCIQSCKRGRRRMTIYPP